MEAERAIGRYGVEQVIPILRLAIRQVSDLELTNIMIVRPLGEKISASGIL